MFGAVFNVKDNSTIGGTIVYNEELQFIEKDTGRSITIELINMKQFSNGEDDAGVAGSTGKPKSGLKTFTEKYQLSCGFLPGFMFPIGEVSSVMKSGFGGNIFGDVIIPVSFLQDRGFIPHGGVSLGYSRFSSSPSGTSAKITMLPLLAYLVPGQVIDIRRFSILIFY